MPKKVFILLFSLLSYGLIKSQSKEFIENSRLEFNKKPNFLLGFDNRYSVLGSESVRIMGMRFGFDYGKIKIYQGLYILQNGIKDQIINPLRPTDTIFTSINFNYISSTVEFVFRKRKHWEFSIPVQLGIGTGSKKRITKDSLIKESQPVFIPSEIAVNGMYKFTDWLALSGGVGYRISLLNTNEFDGAFYSFGLKIFLGKLYRGINTK